MLHIVTIRVPQGARFIKVAVKGGTPDTPPGKLVVWYRKNAGYLELTEGVMQEWPLNEDRAIKEILDK